MRIPLKPIRLFLNLDRLLVTRVFQPFVTLIFKHTGVGNYTIAKYLLIGASSVYVGLFLLAVVGLAISAMLVPQHPWFAYAIVHYGLTLLFVYMLFKSTRHLKRIAVELERHHVRLAARGSLPDFLNPMYLAVFMRIVLLFGYVVTVQLDVLRWVAISLWRGKVVIILDDLIYLIAYTLLCAGCYFIACIHPPPHTRRAKASGSASYAWGH